MLTTKIFTGAKKYFLPLFAFLISLLLVQFPLLNSIGYEFSAFSAFLLSITTSFYVVIKGYSGRKFIDEGQLTLVSVTMAIPFIISVINTKLFAGCPFVNESAFYFVITVPAIISSVFIGLLANRSGINHPGVIVFFFYLMFLAEPVIEFYFNPQVYFYNPIIGYFPGTIYEEEITITWTLVAQRVFYLFFFFSAYKLVSARKKYKLSAFTLFVCLYIFFSFMKPQYGLATGERSIKKELTGTIETEHFNIIYDESLDAKQKKYVANVHEYYYQQLKHDLGYDVSKKITSYLFKDDEQKGKVFGSKNADIAKVWNYSIFIEFGSINRSLKHELVHIFSAEIGVTPLKVAHNINAALIEGFAVAFENQFNGYDLYWSAANAKYYGYDVKLERLFSGLNFLATTSSRAYLFAGAFLRYLYENYGKEKLFKLYQTGDFKSVYGIEIADLEKEFYKFLQSEYTPTEFNEHTANLLFGYKPLVKKFCPRYMANRTREANKLLKEKDYDKAYEAYNEVYENTGSASALKGLIQYYNAVKDYKTGYELVKQHIDEYKKTSHYYLLELYYLKFARYSNENEVADSLYNVITQQNVYPSYNKFALQIEHISSLNKDEREIYSEENSKEKYELVEKLVCDSLYFDLLSAGTGAIDKHYESFSNKIATIDSTTLANNLNAYSAFEVSAYFLSRGNTLLANKFAQYIKGYDKRYKVYDDYLNKLNWFLNNNSLDKVD